MSVVIGAMVPLACAATALPSTIPEVSTTTPEPIRYVALGDSYTIGTSVAREERWPDQLVATLRDRVPLELANLGVNGYSTDDVIRFELPQLADLRPDFVTLQIGVNDVVRGSTLEQYRANVQQILAALLEMLPRDRIVVVSTPDYTRTPRGADYGDPLQQREAIRLFNDAMAAMCAERGIAYVDISAVADAVETDRSLVARDLLHPSGAQYERWVELIAPAVSNLLGQ
jgi:acyl-CoA thioesterase-1